MIVTHDDDSWWVASTKVDVYISDFRKIEIKPGGIVMYDLGRDGSGDVSATYRLSFEEMAAIAKKEQ